MKKTLTKRTGIILLALVMLTSCFVGGTFAKYVTEVNLGGSDTYDGTNGDGSTARVAKWGVTIGSTVNGDGELTGTALKLFDKQYATHATLTDAEKAIVGNYSVVASDYVVAPGTSNVAKDASGNVTTGAVNIKLAGTPEVASRIDVKAQVQLNGNWTVGTGDNAKFYCPLIFYVGGKTVNGASYTSVDALNQALTEAAWSTVCAAGTNLATLTDGVTADGNGEINISIGWEWPFESGNDALDTELGNRAAAAAETTTDSTDDLYVTVTGTVSVTQID